jgi:hypothetical protein
MFRVALKKGQIFTAQAHLTGTTLQSSSVKSVVSLLNSQGTAIAGLPAGESVLYRVTQDGTYFVKLARSDSATRNATTGRAYELDLRPIGLDNNNYDPNLLRMSGGAMYTWLDGNTLYVSGPTGHGFGIQADWVQKTTTDRAGAISSTYTATGSVYLQTAIGLHTMGVASDAGFVVTTKAQANGDAFGEVRSLDFTTTIALSKLVTPFGMTSAWGFDLDFLNVDVAVTARSGIAGIALGSDASLEKSGVPLNAAVPYLFFSVNVPAIGNAAIVVDPSDPALYINSSKGIKLGYLEINGIGFSQHGLIPYTPGYVTSLGKFIENAPSQYKGQLSGHLLLQGSVDTTGITWIPSKVEGDVTINLDPNRTGKLLGGMGATAADLANVFADLDSSGEGVKRALNDSGSAIKHATEQFFRNHSVGVNGTMKINPLAAVQDALRDKMDQSSELAFLKFFHPRLANGVINIADMAADHDTLTQVSVGYGSMIYDGPTLSTYFRSGSVNPFEGTPLEILGSRPSVDLDAAIKFGRPEGVGLYLDVKGKYNVGPFPAEGEVLIANAWDMTPALASKLTGQTYSPNARSVRASGVYASHKVNVLGVDLELTGRVRPNGNFMLTGGADLNFGGLKANATFTLTKTSQGLSLKAAITGSVEMSATIAGVKWTAKASLSGSLTITRTNNNKWSYSGSLKAEGKVTSSIGSVKIDGIDVKVEDNHLVFKLPKIGTKKLGLPV